MGVIFDVPDETDISALPSVTARILSDIWKPGSEPAGTCASTGLSSSTNWNGLSSSSLSRFCSASGIVVDGTGDSIVPFDDAAPLDSTASILPLACSAYFERYCNA